jgi:drug/metabolite transporter (DMT)-like permease
MFTTLVVALRIVANPLANVFQKRLVQGAIHPLVVIGTTHALLTVIVLPFVARVAWHALAPAFWGNMALCALLAVAGNVLLVAALHRTDLSLLGPINAYKAVLSLALAAVVLGEVPSAFGMFGVLLIVLGSVLVVDRAPGQQRVHAFARLFGDRGVQLRLAALVCSATEAGSSSARRGTLLRSRPFSPGRFSASHQRRSRPVSSWGATSVSSSSECGGSGSSAARSRSRSA